MAVTFPRLGVAIQAAKALEARGARRVHVTRLWGSGKTLVAVQTAQALSRPLLIVAPGRIESEAIFDDLQTFAGEEHSVLLPAWEVLPDDAMDPAEDIVAERMHTLERLAEAYAQGRPMYAVAPVRSLLQHVIRRDELARGTLTLEVEQDIDLEDLLEKLVAMGYERELMVEARGQMSLRGGIFDIFPISSEAPYRVELFGDTIESIRRFEPERQRSIDHVERFKILPCSEKAMLLRQSGQGLSPLVDYFPGDTLIAFDEPLAIEEEARLIGEQLGDNPFVMSWEAARERLAPFVRLNLTQAPLKPVEKGAELSGGMGALPGWHGAVDGFWTQLERWDLDGYTVALLCHNSGERRRLFELLEERGYRMGSDTFDLHVEIGGLRAGFTSPADALAVLSEHEIFGRRYVRRRRRRFEAGETLRTFADLKAGDYVVHNEHGVGRYFGLKRFPGKAGDFLAIQYAGGDKLYVPVTSIDQVQRYNAAEGALPKVDRIGGATWARTKARVKKALRDMTEELVKLYAARESQQGHAFSPDQPWQIEFEDAFEYEETPDQARAIVDVKKDMQSPKPMDRLICGDVGFGKTEVALRAAFKAVLDGKQVALLAPTTVLAEQHYMTFSERLADYPMTVEMLSRFRSPRQQKETIERVEAGEVDIVIGTHRLISKDIKFKDLGLLIIDEEQRFGVAQKERMKQYKNLVDVLTLSATPIPRTLNLALTGVRDMSIINTAPNDRLPIHTCVEVFDERLIQEAINRELARQGQIFYVHNRVQDIEKQAELVKKLAPHARIAIGHGQMPEKELERVMTAFIHQEVDVLVCTMIIGSGIDIPNANTIIINNADHFGLSELYQLRGRVGRYKHRAFAYLLVPGDRALSEDAQKRLKALEEFSTLGSGLRIAMRDLEIRGCGNILGGEQHGHIAAVGFDTYAQLIQEAVAELKGEPVKRRELPPFDVAADAYIPEEYVPSETQKITLYKRIAGVHTVDDVEEMAAEIADRFGPIPAPVRRLLDVMRVRALAADAGVQRIVAGKDAIVFEFKSASALEPRARAAVTETLGARAEFRVRKAPELTVRLQGEQDGEIPQVALRTLRALGE